ncbi:MAG: MltA domain-containing protein, partial [Pseudomonadota bacterium]
MTKRASLVLAATFMLAGCAIIPKSGPPSASTTAASTNPTATSAALAGVALGPDVARLGMSSADADAALASFNESCPQLLKRDDQSGINAFADWRRVCKLAFEWPTQDGRDFFIRYFETARVGDGQAFATGYFEPEIAGSRTRRPGYDVPVYVLPDDLKRGWPADV